MKGPRQNAAVMIPALAGLCLLLSAECGIRSAEFGVFLTPHSALRTPHSPGVAHADIVHLTSGKVVEGRVTKDGEDYEVETKVGKVRYAAAMVEKVVEKKTDVDEFHERLGPLKDNDADGHAELAQWCMSHNMPKHATSEFRKALAADPRNLTARVWLATMQVEAVKEKLKKAPSGAAGAMRKKLKALPIRKLLVEIEPRGNTDAMEELSDLGPDFEANLEAKGYELAASEEAADAVYRVLYKTGLSGSYEIDGKKYSGNNIRADVSIISKKTGKEIWKSEIFGFTGAKVKFEQGTSIGEALRIAAVEDFKCTLSRGLPISAAELDRRFKASASFPKGMLKKTVEELDCLLVDLTKDQIDKDDVLACYGYPEKEEFDAGGVNRWIYEEVDLVFEWHRPKKDVAYSILRMNPKYPGTLYGIKIGQPIAKVKEAFDCKLTSENEKAGTGTFIVTPMPNVNGVTKVTGGENQTVEWITIEFGKPPEKQPAQKAD